MALTQRISSFPTGERIDLATLARDPYPTFDALLTSEPLSWVPAFNLWMVTRRDDVIAILRDWQTFTMETESTNSPMEDIFGPMMLSLDGAAHKRMREPFAAPFQARTIRTHYADGIRQLANQLLDEFIEAGGGDLDSAFSDRLALRTVLTVLGLPVENDTQFRSWYDAFANALGNLTGDVAIRQAGREAFQHFRTFLLAEFERMRRRPDDSILSRLVHDDSHDLAQEEIVSATALTFFGGLETTAAMLSNTVWALLTHPHQLAQVKEQPGLMPAALEESLRWQAPVQAAMRFPTRPVTLHGITLQRGEKIYCMLGAANRDPSFFQQPNRFDIHRANAAKHLSFAYGPHFCFGAPLARLEGEIGLTTLFARLPTLQLDPAHPTAPYGHEFRSPPTLYVQW